MFRNHYRNAFFKTGTTRKWWRRGDVPELFAHSKSDIQQGTWLGFLKLLSQQAKFLVIKLELVMLCNTCFLLHGIWFCFFTNIFLVIQEEFFQSEEIMHSSSKKELTTWRIRVFLQVFRMNKCIKSYCLPYLMLSLFNIKEL